MQAERTGHWLQRLFDEQREALLALSALFVFALMLTVFQFGRLDERFREDLQVQAHIVADTAAAALLFGNAEDAIDILSAFRSAAAIEQALLLDASRLVLAGYNAPLQPRGALHRWAGIEKLSVPVMVKHEQVGELIVHASRVGIWQDLARFVGTAAGMLVAALGLAWLVSRRLRAHVREAERRTRYLAHHDALTDLPNRETFRVALERAAQRSRESRQTAAVLFIDLDNFKQINDNHGHAAGDRVLQVVALRLRALLRSNDMAARLAGDEFALLLQAPVDEAMVQQLAARLVDQLRQPVDEASESIRARVSVGVALLPQHAQTAEEAMQCADAAMYHAKRLGKDGYQLFSAELGEVLRARLRLELDLRQALQRQQICLAYQPLFDKEGCLVSFEALARWRHPQRGWVSPVEFIPAAEASGLIVEMGLLALRVLAEDQKAWRTQGLDSPLVALNFSSRQGRRPLDRQRFLAALDELGLGPEVVEFELTESALFEDLGTADSMVALLQQRGYALAIDDFGTGYSSLAYLRRMRCRKLKIDRLFIHGIAASDDARMLVGAIIGVAQAMRMQVVAEGVETAADQRSLVDLGCDLFQGFGLSHPLTPEQAAELLRAQRQGQRVSVQVEPA